MENERLKRVAHHNGGRLMDIILDMGNVLL